jgi:predicted metal-dependent phosphoesterase TrpH
MKLLKTELHCHSSHSSGEKIKTEGLNTPKELIEHAKKLGIDVIAITDHNTINGSIEAKKFEKKFDVLVIKGEEIDSKQGHILAIGIEETIKKNLDFLETIDLIHENAGIAIAAHPFDLANKGLKELAIHADAIEAFNAINIDRISNWNARKFAKKFNLSCTAGSDAHATFMLGHGLNLIKAEKDVDSILKAIKKGKNKLKTKYMTVKEMQQWSIKRLQSSYNDLQNYMQKNYSLPKRFFAKRFLALVKKSPGKIDYLFRAMSYIALSSATIYSALKTVKRKIKK